MAQNRKSVLLTRPDYPEEGIKKLQQKYDVKYHLHPSIMPKQSLLKEIKGVDGLFCASTDKINKEVIEAAGPQLKVIATMSIGFEHIDIEECKKRNIVVCNAPNFKSVGAVAEIIIGLMLAVGRRIVEASKVIEKGEWTDIWSPTWCLGRGLMNSVVGIVGMGRIGNALLKRLMAFEVNEVVYFDVYHPIAQAEECGARFLHFDELLKHSDYVIATCNLTPQSKGLFDARAFNLMKPTSIFINTSRGPVVNQDDLYDALKCHKIKSAALDVMYPEPLPKDHKLVSLPNIVLLPHIAGAEETAVQTLCALAAQNIIEVLEEENPLTPVF